MTKYHIESANFNIEFQIKVFESDIEFSSNTILTVSLNSDGFCATADMDIDIKEFLKFVDSLSAIYSTFSGTAIIQEPYGEQQFIKFVGEKNGHINVSGKLNSNGRNGFSQQLVFENNIDQTYFSDFIKDLSIFCNQYR